MGNNYLNVIHAYEYDGRQFDTRNGEYTGFTCRTFDSSVWRWQCDRCSAIYKEELRLIGGRSVCPFCDNEKAGK